MTISNAVKIKLLAYSFVLTQAQLDAPSKAFMANLVAKGLDAKATIIVDIDLLETEDNGVRLQAKVIDLERGMAQIEGMEFGFIEPQEA